MGLASAGVPAMALERLRSCMHIGRLCAELGISPSTLKRWRKEQEAQREAAPVQFPGETLDEENRRRAWCITLTAACSTLRKSMSRCCACRASCPA